MKERESNIELLRIIAMIMIIGLHFFGYCQANLILTSGINYESLLENMKEKYI